MLKLSSTKSLIFFLENYSSSKGLNPLLSTKAMDTNKRKECRWTLPLEGWHKDNFEGVANGNPGKVGVGGIIRNAHGKGIATVSAPLGMQTNNYAETIMAHQTIKLAWDTGVKNIWLEGDSKSIIDYLNEKNEPMWMIMNIIQNCIQHLKTFDNTYVAHEYREANQVADRLAKWVVKNNEVEK